MTTGDGVQVKGITSLTSSAIESHRTGKALLSHVEFGIVILENMGRSIVREMRTIPMCTSACMF